MGITRHQGTARHLGVSSQAICPVPTLTLPAPCPLYTRPPPRTDQPLPQGTPFPDQFREKRSPATWEAAAALPVLAADGADILATALAAAAKHAAAVGARPPTLCSICGAEVGAGATGGAEGGGGAQGKKEKKKKGGAEQAVKPGRKVGEGVVVEAKVHVPYGERMQRLLGTRGPTISCQR